MRKKSRLPIYVLGGAIVVSIGLLFVGRGGTPGGVGALPQGAGTANIGAHAGGGRNNSAPDFTLQKLDGSTVTLSEFRGKKPVVVDFWASWCPNCRRDMPNLNRYYEKYKDQVEVVGVNLQENENTVKDFIAARGISFPIALDPYGRASQAFGIQYTNTHFLIDRNGNLVRVVPGDISESDFKVLLGA